MSWLTADLPGIGGSYKQSPEDFQVEEIPLYPCSNNGEHLYLWIEKAGITTHNLLSQIARGLKLKDREIGYAGLKDARALTRQMVSVPFNKLDQVEKLNLDNAKILSTAQHGNKLRLGHLAGNRFTITVRETVGAAKNNAEAILEQLRKRGVPNLFGEQRYGILGNSAQLGLLLLQKQFTEFCREYIGDPELIRNPSWKLAASHYRQGELDCAISALPKQMRDERRMLQQLLKGKSAESAVLALPRNILRLFLSATQSQLFDQLVNQRLANVDQLLDGDIAVKHVNGACFRIEEAKAEQSRVESLEISPSAPLFGTKSMLAKGEPGQAELALMAESGLTLESWDLASNLTMTGERRPLRFPLQHASIVATGPNFLTLNFTLPKGCYATSVLRELIKT